MLCLGSGVMSGTSQNLVWSCSLKLITSRIFRTFGTDGFFIQ